MERFGIVNYNVVTDPELSVQAKGVYAIISTFADKNRSCFPSINTIADLANVHPRTISRKLKELSSKGYIKRKGRKIFIL
tara:strand:+ start:1007 stop:1246 length:240 start_codon:yes stop_codon:yes gene_type:complete